MLLRNSFSDADVIVGCEDTVLRDPVAMVHVPPAAVVQSNVETQVGVRGNLYWWRERGQRRGHPLPQARDGRIIS